MNAEGSTPRLLARASGIAESVLTADCASVEEAEPTLVTVTDASTLSSVLVVLMSEAGTPRSVATATASTVGAARETSEEALNDCVTVKLAVVCRSRPCRTWTLLVPPSRRRRAVLTAQSELPAHTTLVRASCSWSTLTPEGMEDSMVETWLMITSALLASPPSPTAALATDEARSAALRVEATDVETATEEVVA